MDGAAEGVKAGVVDDRGGEGDVASTTTPPRTA